MFVFNAFDLRGTDPCMPMSGSENCPGGVGSFSPIGQVDAPLHHYSRGRTWKRKTFKVQEGCEGVVCGSSGPRRPFRAWKVRASRLRVEPSPPRMEGPTSGAWVLVRTVCQSSALSSSCSTSSWVLVLVLGEVWAATGIRERCVQKMREARRRNVDDDGSRQV